MSSTTIPIITATSIPPRKRTAPTGGGRPAGSTKYPFKDLAVSSGDNCPYFTIEAKTRAGASAIGTRGSKFVPGAKFAVRGLFLDDGTQQVAPSGKLLFGVWRVK